MNIGIIGAGTMGAGIAQAFAMAEKYHVLLCDISLELAEKGKARIQKNLDFLVGKEKLTHDQAISIFTKVKTGVLQDCGECDLVIEVSPENLAIKKQVFQQLQDIVKKSCRFATNTSSIAISQISEGLDRPVIGMHFFNPADRLKLVEIIKANNTPESLVAEIKQIANDIGKVPVEVKESSGFVVNRILIPMINEAINVLDSGTASAEDIDIAMQLGAAHPIGPLHLADLIGLDVCLAIMQVIHFDTQDEKYRPASLLEKMVAKQQLGKKTGQGFFSY